MDNFSKKETILIFFFVLVSLFVFWKNPALAGPTFDISCLGNVSPGTYDCWFLNFCRYSACTTGLCPTLAANKHASAVAKNCTTLKPTCAGQCGAGGVPCEGTCPCSISGGNCTYTCDTGWTDCDISAANGCECNTGAGYTCPVTTCIPPATLYTLTVNKLGDGTGKVTSSPAGIDCGSTCSNTFPSGTVVTLTASPDPGSTFLGWSTYTCPGTGPCDVPINGNKNITAKFSTFDFSLSGPSLTTDWITESDITKPTTVTVTKTFGTVAQIVDFSSGVVIPAEATGASVIWNTPKSCTPNPTCFVSFQIRTLTTPDNYPVGYSVTISGSATGGLNVKSVPNFILQVQQLILQIYSDHVLPARVGLFQGQNHPGELLNHIKVWRTSGPPKDVLISVQNAPTGVLITPTPSSWTLGSTEASICDPGCSEMQFEVLDNAQTSENLQVTYKISVPGLISFGPQYIPQALAVYANWALDAPSPSSFLLHLPPDFPPGGTATATVNATLQTEGPGSIDLSASICSDLVHGPYTCLDPSSYSLTVDPSSSPTCTMSGKGSKCPVTIKFTIPSDFNLVNQVVTYSISITGSLHGDAYYGDPSGKKIRIEYDTENFSVGIANKYEVEIVPGPTDDGVVLAPGSGLKPTELPQFKITALNSNGCGVSLKIEFDYPDGTVPSTDKIIAWNMGGPGLPGYSPFEIYAAGKLLPVNYTLHFTVEKTDSDPDPPKDVYYSIKVEQFDFSLSPPGFIDAPRRATENHDYFADISIKADGENTISRDVTLSFSKPSVPPWPSGVDVIWEDGNETVTCPATEMSPLSVCKRTLKITVHPGFDTGNFPLTIIGDSENYVYNKNMILIINQVGDPPQASMSCYASNEYCQDCFCDDSDTSTWVTYNGDSVQFQVKNTTTVGNITESEWNIFKQGTTDPVMPPRHFQGDSAKNSITIPVSTPKLDPGTYTISLQVWDGNRQDDTVQHDITVEKDVTADFACSTDTTDIKTWHNCKDVQAISGSKVFFRDSPFNPNDLYSKTADTVLIISWVWKKKVGNDWVEFSSGSNFKPSTTLPGNFSGYDIQLTVQDNRGRVASVIHKVFSVIPLPKWQEVAPF